MATLFPISFEICFLPPTTQEDLTEAIVTQENLLRDPELPLDQRERIQAVVANAITNYLMLNFPESDLMTTLQSRCGEIAVGRARDVMTYIKGLPWFTHFQDLSDILVHGTQKAITDYILAKTEQFRALEDSGTNEQLTTLQQEINCALTAHSMHKFPIESLTKAMKEKCFGC